MLKVLVVDDEEHMRELVYQVLVQVLGFAESSITVKNNGDDAWTEIQQTTFDLVVTDCHMPGMNGDELVHRIKSSGANTATILMSGMPDKVNVGGKFQPPDVMLAKPFLVSDFVVAVKARVPQAA